MKLLIELQERLRPNCHIKLEHDELYGNWKATVVTERNEWPHWACFRAATPSVALMRLDGYLNGYVPDHAITGDKQKRYLDFLKQSKKLAA